MTELEQHVAAALQDFAISYADDEAGPWLTRVLTERLAPRVAAALEAVHDDHGCVPIGESVCADRALAALRGASSREGRAPEP